MVGILNRLHRDLRPNVTVLDDDARDKQRGSRGRDVFFATLGTHRDKVKDRTGDEVLLTLR